MGESLQVPLEGLQKWSAKLRDKRRRYRELQSYKNDFIIARYLIDDASSPLITMHMLNAVVRC